MKFSVGFIIGPCVSGNASACVTLCRGSRRCSSARGQVLGSARYVRSRRCAGTLRRSACTRRGAPGRTLCLAASRLAQRGVGVFHGYARGASGFKWRCCVEFACAEEMRRREGPAMRIAAMRRFDWYFPTMENPAWPCWGAVVELALRRLKKLLRAELTVADCKRPTVFLRQRGKAASPSCAHDRAERLRAYGRAASRARTRVTAHDLAIDRRGCAVAHW